MNRFIGRKTVTEGECSIRIDEQLISHCVTNYSDMIFRMAFHHTKNKSDAEDITQDVFLSLLKNPKINDETHLKAWLLRVAINKCKDLARSAAKRKNIPLDAVIYKPLEGAKSDLDSSDSDILGSIQKLPELDRSIVFLYYYEGYSAREIGEIVKKSEGAIFTRLKRIRDRLKDILEDEENE